MKTITCILFLAFLLIQPVCLQNKDFISELHGKWIFADNLDCPDVLEFNSNGTYSVFNDCGSFNPEHPIIEKGNWKLESKENVLILFQREFVSPNSVFSEYHGKNDSLSFKINELIDKKLTLCFIKDVNDDCIIENYIRVQ